MYFALLLFWLTGVVAAVVSLMTSAPPSWRLVRTTFFTRFSESKREDELPVTEMEEAAHTTLHQLEMEREGEERHGHVGKVSSRAKPQQIS